MTDKKSFDFFFRPKIDHAHRWNCLPPICLPVSWHHSKSRRGGGGNYFCNCHHPSPKLVWIVDSTLMYCNSTDWSLVQPLSQLTLFAVFNAHSPLLGCRGEKKLFLRFLSFDVWREGQLSGQPFCSHRIPGVRILSDKSYLRPPATNFCYTCGFSKLVVVGCMESSTTCRNPRVMYVILPK